MFTIAKSWYEILKEEFEKDYYIQLTEFLEKEYNSKTIYPEPEKVFNSINTVPYDKVRVVIIGQDPYHEPNQAHGLSFSVEKDVKLPPSLQNIYKEISNEYGYKMSYTNGNLSKWARQGVLLLNSVLTVEKGAANSHKNMGWEKFTTAIIKKLNQRDTPIVFLLWGASAKAVGKYVDKNRHFILESVHPSPLSAYNGFFGCGHFKKANELLASIGQKEIDWRIDDL